MITCCKGCTDRCAEPSCHETCEKYLAEKKKEEEIRTKKRSDSIYCSYAKNASIERKLEWRKKHKY